LKHILMLAAENGAITGAKVGGLADVIRDIPPALARQDVIADVVMPGYGKLVATTQAEFVCDLSVPFGWAVQRVSVFRCQHPQAPEAHIYLLEHDLFHSQDGGIYTKSSPDRPFAEDASKFALFCVSVATALATGAIPRPDVLHLHDWHAGLLALLRAYDPQFASLQSIPCVFSVHNLAMQGTRPLRQDASSFEAWYPWLLLTLSSQQLATVCDPRHPQCINPMRTGIVLSDRVHLVSPSYVDEVLQPSRAGKGFFGGEGLEQDLRQKKQSDNLIGILNGCEYRQAPEQESVSGSDGVVDLMGQIEIALIGWQAEKQSVSGVDQIAFSRLNRYWRQESLSQEKTFLLTSVGRLTDQKMLILRQHQENGQTVLETLLEIFARIKPAGLFVLLGSGDHDIAKEFQQIAARRDNFLFLNGYHETLPESLYRLGDLFLMPSSFEPCGISQMLALREGQPCLVHGVGGLKDTVTHLETGFVFNGDSLAAQGDALLKVFAEALELHRQPKTWQTLCEQARAQRFSWDHSASQYLNRLYV